MTTRALAAAAIAVAALAASSLAEEKRPVPLYTNDDLRRMEPLRGETGATSLPAVTLGPPDAAPPAAREAVWRRDAERVRRHVFVLRQRQALLRGRVEDERTRRSASSSGGRTRARSSAAMPTRSLERQIEAIEAQIREEESDLEDRARRAGALPGWLR